MRWSGGERRLLEKSKPYVRNFSSISSSFSLLGFVSVKSGNDDTAEKCFIGDEDVCVD